MFGFRRYYPDNSGIHARQIQGRRQRATATFVEKLDALDELRERVEPIVRAREARRQHLLAAPEHIQESF
jgi:predicted transcriptional regulator